MNRSRVGTLVERATLFVALVKLDDGRAETTANGFATILNRFQSPMRLSLTYDQGREMAQHKSFSDQTGMKVYFAHPHSPWERGLNENTNGLIRQYLPKGKDLSVLSQKLDEIAMEVNARPRKTLGWKAPAELFLPHGEFDSSSSTPKQIQSSPLHFELESTLLLSYLISPRLGDRRRRRRGK